MIRINSIEGITCEEGKSIRDLLYKCRREASSPFYNPTIGVVIGEGEEDIISPNFSEGDSYSGHLRSYLKHPESLKIPRIRSLIKRRQIQTSPEEIKLKEFLDRINDDTKDFSIDLSKLVRVTAGKDVEYENYECIAENYFYLNRKENSLTPKAMRNFITEYLKKSSIYIDQGLMISIDPDSKVIRRIYNNKKNEIIEQAKTGIHYYQPSKGSTWHMFTTLRMIHRLQKKSS